MDQKPNPDQNEERLFAGPVDPTDDLDQVGALFAALRAEASVSLDEQTIARYVRNAAHTAQQQSTTPASMSAGERGRSLLGSLRTRVAAFTAGVAVLVGGMGGVAVAADHAKPGDVLYGIDRALEAVGIGDGEAEERLAEARALVDAGEVPRGIRHATEAVPKEVRAESPAADALEKAADRVRSGGSEQSTDTRDQVAGLLTYLAENAGSVDGQQVAELAREIGRSDSSTDESEDNSPGRPESPGNSPDQPPGQSETNPGSQGNPHGEPPGQTKDKPNKP